MRCERAQPSRRSLCEEETYDNAEGCAAEGQMQDVLDAVMLGSASGLRKSRGCMTSDFMKKDHGGKHLHWTPG